MDGSNVKVGREYTWRGEVSRWEGGGENSTDLADYMNPRGAEEGRVSGSGTEVAGWRPTHLAAKRKIKQGLSKS